MRVTGLQLLRDADLTTALRKAFEGCRARDRHGLGSELAVASAESDLVKALQAVHPVHANRSGQPVVERNLNVQPTITSGPAGRCGYGFPPSTHQLLTVELECLLDDRQPAISRFGSGG